jgi:hypothetical protein
VVCLPSQSSVGGGWEREPIEQSTFVPLDALPPTCLDACAASLLQQTIPVPKALLLRDLLCL